MPEAFCGFLSSTFLFREENTRKIDKKNQLETQTNDWKSRANNFHLKAKRKDELRLTKQI